MRPWERTGERTGANTGGLLCIGQGVMQSERILKMVWAEDQEAARWEGSHGQGIAGGTECYKSTEKELVVEKEEEEEGD